MYQRMHVFIVNAHIWFFLDAFYLKIWQMEQPTKYLPLQKQSQHFQ